MDPRKPDLAPGTEEAYRARLRAANISDRTFLATDYLNHFNEAVMLVQLVGDMPDMIDEVKAWSPKSYADHFRDSGFTNKDLAIDAFYRAPERYRAALITLVGHMNDQVAQAVQDLEASVVQGPPERVKLIAEDWVRHLGGQIDLAGAVIHGEEESRSAQDDIDRLIAEN